MKCEESFEKMGLTDREREERKERQTDRRMDRKTDKQRERDRQTDRGDIKKEKHNLG